MERALAAFAEAAGVELVPSVAVVSGGAADFRDDPTQNFGRVVRRTPLAVLRPRTQEQVAACLRHLHDEGVPHAVRGAAMSSGAQALVADGVVIDLRHLARVVADDPAGETITVEAGAPWLVPVEHLRTQGRRPRSITANLRATVGGTLSVGGFGDASHLHGLQITHVVRLALALPDGRLARLGPDDELFRFALAGVGQIGVIVEVTLETERRSYVIAGRRLEWGSLAEFLRDAATIRAYALYDFLRVRAHVGPDGATTITAHVGRSLPAPDAPLEPEPWRALLGPRRASPLERVDLHELLAADPSPGWRLACPAMEVVLPLPDALAAWPELAARIAEAGLPALQPLGHALMVVPDDGRFPLAPLPPCPARHGLMVALRPEVPPDAAPALLPALRAIGRRGLELGGRLYLMSVDVGDPGFADQQFGPAMARLRALKADLDPRGLLNPGLLS